MALAALDGWVATTGVTRYRGLLSIVKVSDHKSAAPPLASLPRVLPAHTQRTAPGTFLFLVGLGSVARSVFFFLLWMTPMGVDPPLS